MKSYISFYFCEKYGERQEEYLTSSNYNYSNLRFKKDRFGNAMGGLRSPYVDCPLYVYTPAGGTERRLTDDEIRSLYSSREDYVKKVTASVNKMLEKRYILPEHAEMVIKEAEEAELPF